MSVDLRHRPTAHCEQAATEGAKESVSLGAETWAQIGNELDGEIDDYAFAPAGSSARFLRR